VLSTVGKAVISGLRWYASYQLIMVGGVGGDFSQTVKLH